MQCYKFTKRTEDKIENSNEIGEILPKFRIKFGWKHKQTNLVSKLCLTISNVLDLYFLSSGISFAVFPLSQVWFGNVGDGKISEILKISKTTQDSPYKMSFFFFNVRVVWRLIKIDYI